MTGDLRDALEQEGGADVMVIVEPSHGEEALVQSDGRADLGAGLSNLRGVFARGQSQARVASSRSPSLALQSENGFIYFPQLGVVLARVDREGLRQLEDHNAVGSIGLVPQFEMIGSEPKAALTAPTAIEWGLIMMGAPELWARGFKGAGVSIGHLDSGIEPHPALAGAIADFAAFDPLGRPINASGAYGIGGHGTHTAGILCARPSNNQTFGMAPGAKLVSALSLDTGQLFPARVLAGLQWLATKRVRVLSMSFGLKAASSEFEQLIVRMRAAGTLPIAAIGNTFPDRSRAPANFTNVLSVGACASDKKIWPGSIAERFNRPERSLVPDLVGPGAEVRSCAPGGGSALAWGTSQAAPHIAGLAALLISAKPRATSDEIERAILASCKLPPELPQDRANRGIPNGLVALQTLLGAGV